MNPVIFCRETALHAIRSSRTWRNGIFWEHLDEREQAEVLRDASSRLGDCDFEQLIRLGVAHEPKSNEHAELHVLVSRSNKRSRTEPILPHSCSVKLPPGSLLKLTSGVYIVKPELCFVQMAAVLDVPHLFKLGFELMGIYTLPADGSFGFTPSEPAMTVDSLTAYLGALPPIKGKRNALQALPYLLERSRSPMESATVIMLATPQLYGGFGMEQPTLNHKIELNEEARKACELTEIECDAFFAASLVDLEYDSVYHNNEQQRQRDTERETAFACMDIIVVRISASQFKDLNKLEAIARLLARRGGKQYRVRTRKHKLQQALLHGALSEDLSDGPSDNGEKGDDDDAAAEIA